MKLSSNTKKILTNFASINNSINIQVGNQLRTLSLQENVMAIATVEEQFSEKMSVYSISEFLKALALLDDPELTTNEHQCSIVDGNKRLLYTWAIEGLVNDAPPGFPPHEVLGEFLITAETLSDIKSAANTMKLDTLIIKSDGSLLSLRVCFAKDNDKHSFEIDMGKCPISNGTYNVNIKTDNILMIPGDYTVQLLDQQGLIFSNNTADLKYLIATEADSTPPTKSL